MMALAAGTTAIGLAGCAGSPAESGDTGGPADGDHEPGHGHSGSIGPATATAEVTVNTTEDGEQHFEPHVVHVETGGTVTWTLESGSHTATAYHPDNDQPRLVPEGAAAWDSGMLSESGATFEHTFEVEGVHHYYCIPHESMGMIGSVVVGDPHLDEQVALEEPPQDKPEEVRHKIAELNSMMRSELGDEHGDDGQHEETTEHHEDDGHHEETTEHHEETTEHHG